MTEVFARFVFEGDEAAIEGAALVDMEAIRAALREAPELAFRLLHDRAAADRLTRGFDCKVRDFSSEVESAIDVIVGRASAHAEPRVACAARLLCASGLNWGGAPGRWLSPLPQLAEAGRASAIAAIGQGDLTAVSGVQPAGLLRLVVDPRASQFIQKSPWLSSLAREAVTCALRDMRADGGAIQIAELRVIALHAWCCCDPDDDVTQREIGRFAGSDAADMQALREAILAAGDASGLWSIPGPVHWEQFLEHRMVERARRWLDFKVDQGAIELCVRIRDELPSVVDPWVRWAMAHAVDGAFGQPVFGLLVELGEHRRDRARVLGELWARGLLEGDSAVEVLRSELPPSDARSDEREAFIALFSQRVLRGSLEGLPPALDAWFRDSCAAYFRSPAALQALAPIKPELEALFRNPRPPAALVPLIELLRRARRNSDRVNARKANREWMVNLVEFVEAHPDDRESWDAGHGVLLLPDQEVLAKLVERMNGPTSFPPWYALDEGLSCDFRLREAAFRLGFVPADAFKEVVRKHAKGIIESAGLSGARAVELRDLCERCALCVLGRVKNAQPRSRTMDAFRLGDARAMLEGEAAPDVSAPPQIVPLSVVSPVTAVCAAAVVLIAVSLLSMLAFGGTAVPTGGAVGRAQVSGKGPAAGTPTVQKAFDDGGYAGKPLDGKIFPLLLGIPPEGETVDAAQALSCIERLEAETGRRVTILKWQDGWTPEEVAAMEPGRRTLKVRLDDRAGGSRGAR